MRVPHRAPRDRGVLWGGDFKGGPAAYGGKSPQPGQAVSCRGAWGRGRHAVLPVLCLCVTVLLWELYVALLTAGGLESSGCHIAAPGGF